MIGLIRSSPTFTAYFLQLPRYAVWITGICFCLTRWRRHPKVCAVALAGFAGLFLESLFGTLFSYHFLPRMLQGSRNQDIWIHYLIWIFRGLIQAGLLCFILAAIFGWRGARRTGAAERGPSGTTSAPPVTPSAAEGPG